KRNVINYTDDFEKFPLFTSTTYALSDRVFVGPKVTRGGFVNDHDLRMIGSIRRVEGPTLLQTNTHRSEVIATYRFKKHFRILVRRRLGSTLNQKRTTAVEAKHRMRTANRSVLHTRQRAQTILQFRQENNPLLILFVFISPKTHLCRHEPINLPARIGIDEALQATQEQSCRGKQHQRKRDFTD